VTLWSGRAGQEQTCALGLAWQGLTGSVTLLKQLREAGVQGVWRASRKELAAWGLTECALGAFVTAREGFDRAEAQAILERSGQCFMGYGSQSYPSALYQLEFPPAGLFLRGPVEAMERLMQMPRMTVVGTRAATAEGIEATKSFAAELAERGIGVLSGMALGIDGQAHKTALQARGITGAVLGCGADFIYPPRHRWLYGRIVEAGVVLSELPPGSPPTKWTFPHRNRLLAALADGVLVVEGSNTSGALQTARWALELGRPVYCVPGSIFRESSEGCNSLIYDGATPALRADVLVEDFLWDTRMQRGGRGPAEPARAAAGEQMQLNGMAGTEDTDRAVLKALGGGPCSVDGLVSLTGLAVREVSATLGRLEIHGAVARAGPGLFLRSQ
jgi:DNA processing protein